MPVSYTHLDVYKRQPLNLTSFEKRENSVLAIFVTAPFFVHLACLLYTSLQKSHKRFNNSSFLKNEYFEMNVFFLKLQVQSEHL